MLPFTVNGVTWNVVRVDPGDPVLVDWTGNLRLATTDPLARIVNVSSSIAPPLLDKVMVHEAAHAAIESHGMAGSIGNRLNEFVASAIEGFGMEAIEAASEALGRPVCISGLCK